MSKKPVLQRKIPLISRSNIKLLQKINEIEEIRKFCNKISWFRESYVRKACFTKVNLQKSLITRKTNDIITEN